MSLLDLVRGATFDDFLFNPQYSVIERRDPSAIELTCRFSTGLTLKRPIVSANMDTVTRSEMAIAVAEEGGIGIIDRGFRSGEIEPQVREVEIVKRKQHGIIADPYTVAADVSLADAAARMRATGVGTLVVVDSRGRLQGLLTTRDLRFVDRSQGTVASRMTPRGDIEPTYRVQFSVGDHGPFTLEFKKADFTPENVKTEQEKVASTLRGIM